MNRIQDKITYSGSAGLTELLLDRLNGFKTDDSRITICHEQPKGRVEYIGRANHYRLFFLLGGKTHLKGASLGGHLLYAREFILLPPGGGISCAALLESKYVVMNCTALLSEGNRSYLKGLNAVALGGRPDNATLPILEKLERVLNALFAYSTDDSRYPAVYDAVFILLRTLYAPQELALLLYPLLHGTQTAAGR